MFQERGGEVSAGMRGLEHPNSNSARNWVFGPVRAGSGEGRCGDPDCSGLRSKQRRMAMDTA